MPDTRSDIDMLRGHRVSVLIPCLNEERNLPYVLRAMPSWVHEVVIIDDHCTDRTVDVARRRRRGHATDSSIAHSGGKRVNARPRSGDGLRLACRVVARRR